MISTYLIAAVLKVLLLALPVSVALLALRRTMQSQTANAWLYGAVVLYAVVTAVGVLPWAIGLASPPGLFLSLSALSPFVWMAVVVLCDRERVNRYDNNGLPEPTAAPLLLVNPEFPTVPMFRHHDPDMGRDHEGRAPVFQRKVEPEDPVDPAPTEVTRNVLAVARAMRGKLSEDDPTRHGAAPPANKTELRDMPFLARAPG